MVRTTRAQRVALKAVYDRTPLYETLYGFTSHEGLFPPVTYRQFRRAARSGYGCIMVHWCGMWLGIEPDGYTHS